MTNKQFIRSNELQFKALSTIDHIIFKLTKTQTAFNGPKTALQTSNKTRQESVKLDLNCHKDNANNVWQTLGKALKQSTNSEPSGHLVNCHTSS